MIPQYDDDDADDDGADEFDVELDQKADVAMQCFMTRLCAKYHSTQIMQPTFDAGMEVAIRKI